MNSFAPSKTRNLNDHVDDHVDMELNRCLDLDNPTSFFMFAGAGSGKTRSLVKALRELRERSGNRLALRGQQIAVVTYTNAACDEIIRRLEYDPLISVSTIHSFVWTLIQGFNNDIRAWLKNNLSAEIVSIQEEHARGRKGTQAAIDREQKIEANQKRLDSLDGIMAFVYSPTGANRTRDALNHSEVIKLGAAFLTSKPLMQRLLVSKFPALLIDESQDTNKLLMDAFLAVQATHSRSFCLGLIGDTMQRIYADGKPDLGTNLPADWKTPAKKMNHRCPQRVVKLINKIRSAVDAQKQTCRSDSCEGHIRCFIVPSDTVGKIECERTVRQRMATVCGDELWNKIERVKVLTLEHHMAAQRMGFVAMFKPLDGENEFKTALRDGSLAMVRFFSELVLPLVTAKREGNEFAVAALVREKSPLLSKDAFSSPFTDQAAQVKAAKEAVEAIMALFSNAAQPTFLAVLKATAKSKLFTIPESLLPFLSDGDVTNDVDDESNGPAEDSPATKQLSAVRAFLDGDFSQIEAYHDYIRGESPFATHQGVKGLEFPRVVVILDDESAGGFLFSFEKLFGAKEKTTTDLRNEKAGSETGIDRTRRLLYVTCSRSQSSLALVAYTSSPEAVKKTLLMQEWFDDSEIEILQAM